MEAAEALSKMIVPSQKRPCWLGGIIQIQVGRACDLSCVSCSQGSGLAGRLTFMTPGEFEQAVLSLELYPGVIGCFGGNPCLSPHFEEYCRILRGHVPFARRGLWSNHPRGRGAACRITFDPSHSNLNCHMSSEAHAEFSRDWPEAIPFLKGMDRDSEHGAPFVAMRDVIEDEGTIWELISKCDVNQFWSACIGSIPGRGLRAYLCELAFAQANLHCDDPDWPDLGLEVKPGWWRLPIQAFEQQVRHHCFACGIPMRRPTQPAIGGTREEFSETHRHIARPKTRGRPVEFVEIGGMVARPDRPATEYLPGTTPRRP